MYSYIKADQVRRLCWGKSKPRRCCMKPPRGTLWLEEEKLDFRTFAPMKRVLSHSSSQIINFRGEAVSVGRWKQQNNTRGSSFQLSLHANYLQMCSRDESSWSWICTWTLNIYSDMKKMFQINNPGMICVFMHEGGQMTGKQTPCSVCILWLKERMKPKSNQTAIMIKHTTDFKFCC